MVQPTMKVKIRNTPMEDIISIVTMDTYLLLTRAASSPSASTFISTINLQSVCTPILW